MIMADKNKNSNFLFKPLKRKPLIIKRGVKLLIVLCESPFSQNLDDMPLFVRDY